MLPKKCTCYVPKVEYWLFDFCMDEQLEDRVAVTDEGEDLEWV